VNGRAVSPAQIALASTLALSAPPTRIGQQLAGRNRNGHKSSGKVAARLRMKRLMTKTSRKINRGSR
jgi:hypothetical protein